MDELKEQNQEISWDGEISPVELKAAAEVVQAFLMAIKNYGLFPPEHASTINLLRGLCANLNSYVNKYGSLRLVFERGRIRYEEEVVFEEYDPENNPAFVFFRDGILWLEFQEGLEPREILLFFRVLARFKVCQEEPEGDLVTELWSADLPHINYGVSEHLWEAEPILEFSLLNPDGHAVLEQGGGVGQHGFDLLKSVLGLAHEPSDPARKGKGPGEEGAAPGEEEGVGSGGADSAGPGEVPGDLSDAGSGPVPGDGSPEFSGTAGSAVAGLNRFGKKRGDGSEGSGAEMGTGAGLAGGGDLGSRKTMGPELDGKGAAEVEELDFWAALKKVSPAGNSASGAGALAKRDGASSRRGDDGVDLAVESPSAALAGYGGPGGPRKSDGGPTDAEGTGGRMDAGVTDTGRGGAKSAKASAKPGPGGVLSEDNNPAPTSESARDRASALSRPERVGDWGEADSSADGEYIGVSTASIDPGHGLWRFSEEEQRTLKEMVRVYEEKDNSSDVIELLLILLKMEDEPQIVIAIVGFLKEEFRISLVNRNFGSAHNLLVEIDNLRWRPGLVKDWSWPFLDKFMEDVAEPEILDALAPLWAELPTLDHDALHSFAALLQLLPPKSGEALVGMSSQVEFGNGRRILIDLIASFASRDLDILERMLNRPEEDLILRLVRVLRAATDHVRAEQLLLKAIKHPKDMVRQEICDILLDRETEQCDRLFPLIHDPSPAIRERIFAYLGRKRSARVESLFAVHIASTSFLNQNQEHVGQCYLALGCCGSDESVPLLKKILFGQPWNFMVGLGQSSHRQGAAAALRKIRTMASLKALAEAEASSVPHIRRAWSKAIGN
jgi:hypothetical protein